MIYYQCARVAINKPEDENEDFTWYWLEEGITSDNERHNEKKYIWSDEKLENFQHEINIDDFLESIRKDKAKYFKIKKKLFGGREYLVCDNGCYKTWYLDEIKRMDVKFYYEEQHMTLDEAKKYLDVEEYAKMVKGLGLKEV